MISTLTSLLTRTESRDADREATVDRRAADDGDPTPVDAGAVVPAEDAAVGKGDGSPSRTDSDEADETDTDWEFVAGVVDRAQSETGDVEADTEATDADAKSSSPPEAVTGHADGRPARKTNPFARVPLADIEEQSLPIVDAEGGAAGEIPGRSSEDSAGTTPNGRATDAKGEGDEEGDTTEEFPSPPSSERESVVEALLGELESTDLSTEEQARLREALGVEPPRSVHVRLSHLQSEVADLRAYADTIDRVLEDESEADRIARDLGRRIDGVRDRLDETVASLESDLAAETAAREADVERLETRIDGVATTLTDSMVALHHDVETLRDEVEANREWREDVTAAVASPDD